MRVLVTGVSGFVGGHLVEHLAAEGDLIVGLSTSGCWPRELAHLEKLARIEPFNLLGQSETALGDLVSRKQPEVIYHLAAQSNPQESISDPHRTWNLNLVGSLKLLEAVRCSGQKPRVVLVSSGVCYGNPEAKFIPVNENCPLRPNNPYAASKAAVDLLGVQHYLTHGTETIIVRPFNHAGPRQSARYVLASLALHVAEVEQGQRTHVEVGNLDIIRDFIDVRDVVRAYRQLAYSGQPGEIYNLGSGQGTKIANAFQYLCSQARKEIPIRVDNARLRPVDQPLLIADTSKLRNAVKWEPRYTIEHTLSDMLQFSRSVICKHPS